MLKWQDPLSLYMETRLKILADDLRVIKPQGWSVILSRNEIIVRPKDRTLGKFSITSVREEKFYTAFFSRELNIWNKSRYFSDNDSIALNVKEWMESEVADPLKRVDQ